MAVEPFTTTRKMLAYEISLSAIARWEQVIESRPPQKPDGLFLGTAQCEHNCTKCYMSCAIAEARLQWWEEELARRGGVPAFALKKAA